MKARSSGAAPLLLVTLAIAAPCRAESASRALLLLPACPLEGVTEQELRAALALELQADGVTLAEPRGGLGRSDLLLEVESSCQPGAELRLRVLFHDRERERTLSLAELPPGTRARMLALSLAELVDRLEPTTAAPAEPETEASEAPSTGEPSPAAAPAASAAPSPPPAQATAPEPNAAPAWNEAPLDSPPESKRLARRTAFGVAPELRWFAPSSALFGGRLAFDVTRLTGGAGLLVGRSSSNVGDVEALLVHGFAGYRLLDEELGRGFSLGFGPRVGFGWLRAVGSSSNAGVETSSVSAPYFDASAFGDLRCDVSPLFSLSFGAEAGVARGLVALADGDQVASYDGVFVSGFLGIWLSP